MADHKRKKKRGRSKLFRSCFRSFAPDERPLSYRKSDARINKNGRLGKPVLVAVSGSKEEEEEVFHDVDDRSAHSGGLSRLLKAVLFDSVMVKKKICSSSKSSTASDTNESLLSIAHTSKPSEDTNANASGIESTDVEDSTSVSSNLLTSSSRNTTTTSYSSSSSSSTNSNPQWLSEPKTSSPTHLADSNPPIASNSGSQSCYHTDSINLNRQNTSISLPLTKSNSIPQSSSSYNNALSRFDSTNSVSTDKIKSGCNSWSIRWCLFLLLSLIVLVMYGRIYAILCTSIWFYLVPRGRVKRVKRVNSVTNAARVMDTESEQYKKRVIMAGLLDRTRNPIR